MYADAMQNHTALTDDLENQTVQPGITQKITRYLRWIGTLLIVISAISFMLQGHEDLLPNYRYWIGLGFTLLLCIGGLICAKLFKETKGARIFFGLGAAFLPVQISQVSAMLYSYWHGQAALQPEYEWLRYLNVSPALITLDLIISAGLLITVGYAGFSILARKHLRQLLIIFSAANTLLLLPIRDAGLIAPIIAGLFITLRHYEQQLRQERTMRLPEGLAARALISLPLWIMIGRSLLHPGSYLLATVLAGIVSIVCIIDLKHYTRSGWLLYLGQCLGAIAAVLAWLIIVNQLPGAYRSQYSTFLPIIAILFLLSNYATYHPHWYRNLASLLTVCLSYGALLNEQALAPLFSIAVGSLLIIIALRHQEKTTFFCGNLCAVGGFLFYLQFAVNIYSAAPWLSSIGLGLCIILLASYLEKHETQFLSKSKAYWQTLKSWN